MAWRLQRKVGRVALAARSPSAATPLRPMAFGGWRVGGVAAGEEPPLGWGVCSLRRGARLTCPPERVPVPGRVCASVCVCRSVCAHAFWGWSDTAVGFSLAQALRLLSPQPAGTPFGKLGSFIFLNLPLHPPLVDLTFPSTQGAAAGHPSTGANTPAVSNSLPSPYFPLAFLRGSSASRPRAPPASEIVLLGCCSETRKA